VVLSVGGECVTLAGVRARYPGAVVSQAPRGRSLDEETSHSVGLEWGELSFGFSERNPRCLSSVTLSPKKPG
jgi:hypothetical protein